MGAFVDQVLAHSISLRLLSRRLLLPDLFRNDCSILLQSGNVRVVGDRLDSQQANFCKQKMGSSEEAAKAAQQVVQHYRERMQEEAGEDAGEHASAECKFLSVSDT